MQKPKSIHFVGIKGVGMTPLALIAKEAGIAVTGSDVPETFITDLPLSRAGIVPLEGFAPEHVGNVDLVITTNAHQGFSNPEVKEARARGIPVLTKGEAVGAFMEGSILGTHYTGISVAGTHGKTTTAAMLATILTSCGKDPGYLIGTSEIPSLAGMPGHFGRGKHFVAEADEYVTEPNHDRTPQFIYQHPEIAIITNIDHDHPDIYPTLADVEKAFLQFAHQIEKGVVIICGDDATAKEFLKRYTGNVITYGFSPVNDYVITNYQAVHGRIHFTVQGKEIDLGAFMLSVPGEHNALNSLAACLAAREAGISFEESKKALLSFQGTKRRLEYKGILTNGALLYDDYAHHPTEITSSLHALKRMYPTKQLVCIFQPHTYSRTKELFEEFSGAFTDADELIMLPIFASAREQVDETVTSELLAEAIKKKGKNTQIQKNRSDVVEYIRKKEGNTLLFVTMGAGDVYKIADELDFEQKNDDYRK